MAENPEGEWEHRWEAGFEGDRRVVVSRLGPFRRIFPRPRDYRRRFHHQVYDLCIEDWEIPLEPLKLGPLCTVKGRLAIRFQPTIRYVHEHPDRIDDLGAHIRGHYVTLLQDAAEQELLELERNPRVDENYTALEHRIEDLIHELLALRNIQSRARCTITIEWGDPEALDAWEAGRDERYEAIYLELLRRRRELAEKLSREEFDREARERELRLEHEARMVELVRRETELQRARQNQESELARTTLHGEESRSAESFKSEVRLREERIKHESRLRQMELDADLADKARRAGALDDVEHNLQREIELLAMERQRLNLEQEIQDVKVARAKGWVINAKRRFPLGEEKLSLDAQDAEITTGTHIE